LDCVVGRIDGGTWEGGRKKEKKREIDIES
jgi:hypothetical protein